MAITFTNLVGDWRRIVEDYVTDPGNAADAPGVEGTITVTPLLGEGRHAPKGVPSGGVFYTFAPLDLRVYRGLLMDENMNSDITLAIEVDEYPVAWRAKFDLQYRRIKIPLQDVIFGPNEIVGGQISLSSLVTRDGLPPEYEGSYVQLMDAVRAAADHADRAEQAADNVDAAVAGAADVVVAAVEADRVAAEAAATAAAADRVQTGLDRSSASGSASAAAGSATAAASSAEDAELWATSFGLTATSTTGAPGTSASVTVTGSGPEYGLALTVPRGDKGAKGDDGEVSQAALDAAVATLVDNAPEALNTLSELATSLGNDPNFATTVSTQIGERAKTSDVNAALAGKASASHSHTAAEVGARPASYVPAWSEVSGKPATFPPTIGTTASTAKAGNYVPAWSELTGKPTTFTPATHSHTKAEVGLANVDNTSDANKPVSTAQQSAINAKVTNAGGASGLWIGTASSLPATGTSGVLYVTTE